MKVLSIRTDNPEAEIAFFDNSKKVAEIKWPAHKQLSETIHIKIKELLEGQSITFNDLDAVICYKGPGSFTGLRIGLTAANTIAQQLQIPIIGESSDSWQKKAVDKILSGQDAKVVMPEYGAEPHITVQKK